VRESKLQSSAAAEELRQAYRFNILNSRINESKIETVFALMRSSGIEPILIKGWAAARHYPEQGLRPYGDIDICVRRGDYQSAARELASLDSLRFRVDLHAGFRKFGIRSEEELFARSQLVAIGQTEVRILGAEDHLRVVCFHLMREGAWRPLWLADVAAALESRPPGFDWDYCLSERRQARPVVCAIGLAHLLLGAAIDGLPSRLFTGTAGALARNDREDSEAPRFSQQPRWLIPTVLNEWGSPTPSMTSRHAVPMLRYLRHQGDLLNGLRHRWPNPIEATTTMNGPFNELPRLPFQIGNSLLRIGAFLKHLPKARNKPSNLSGKP
jgi:hypothetical protein